LGEISQTLNPLVHCPFVETVLKFGLMFVTDTGTLMQVLLVEADIPGFG
jgi:hypothetical protein